MLKAIETLSTATTHSKKGVMRGFNIRLEESVARSLEAIAVREDRSVTAQAGRFIKDAIAADEAALSSPHGTKS